MQVMLVLSQRQHFVGPNDDDEIVADREVMLQQAECLPQESLDAGTHRRRADAPTDREAQAGMGEAVGPAVDDQRAFDAAAAGVEDGRVITCQREAVPPAEGVAGR